MTKHLEARHRRLGDRDGGYRAPALPGHRRIRRIYENYPRQEDAAPFESIRLLNQHTEQGITYSSCVGLRHFPRAVRPFVRYEVENNGNLLRHDAISFYEGVLLKGYHYIDGADPKLLFDAVLQNDTSFKARVFSDQDPFTLAIQEPGEGMISFNSDSVYRSIEIQNHTTVVGSTTPEEMVLHNGFLTSQVRADDIHYGITLPFEIEPEPLTALFDALALRERILTDVDTPVSLEDLYLLLNW